MTRKTRGIFLTKTKLIKIFQKIKRSPNKVFVGGEFGDTKDNNFSHLDTLIKLGVIEQVLMRYYTGRKYKACRNVRGYKLIKKGVEGDSS